jgi:hypothetical protein
MHISAQRPPRDFAEKVETALRRHAAEEREGLSVPVAEGFRRSPSDTVTTANGQTRKFWERNLRLKTDASGDGPEKNAPALIRAGMASDRADVIFADPSEISPFIAAKC